MKLPRALWLPLLGVALVGACRGKEEAAPQAAVTASAACDTSTNAASAACGSEGSKPAALHAKTSSTELTSFCQKHCAAQSFDEKDVVPAAQAKIGDLTRCPVSGVVFRVTGETPRVEYAGQSRWVCCPGCAEHFRDNPARFSGS